MIAAALDLAARGWRVLPVASGGKQPLGHLVPHGWHEVTSDAPTVRRWWTAAPAANIGVACAPSALVVVDVDPRNGGDDALLEFRRASMSSG